MHAPSQLLRVVFAASALACSLILMLFLRGRAPQDDMNWGLLLLGTGAVAAVACALAFRGGRMRLQGVAWAPLLHTFLWQLLWTYLVCATLLTLIGWGLVVWVTRSPLNAAALATLAGAWLSLWLAPGVAAWRTARRLQPPAPAAGA
ncbi:MAG: hypothetical protein U1E77_16395 [Inhella sp.]